MLARTWWFFLSNPACQANLTSHLHPVTQTGNCESFDQTGLGNARYTLVVKFTPDPGMRPFGGPPLSSRLWRAISTRHPTCSAPWNSNWAWHMRKTKAPVEVMTIDKTEKPFPN
ncbi:MAG TPA: hypothetical protein VG675_09490 [Bryobacteraceae bacterium]|nr:hypothetical protein [Bryobacteraceae bacterium]